MPTPTIARGTMDDALLERLLPLACGSPTGRDSRCPDVARWVALVEGSLDRAERLRLEAHLADCAACLGEVGFLLRDPGCEPLPAVPAHLLDAARPRRFFEPVRWRPFALPLAAAATLIVALLAFLPNGAGAPDDALPEGDALRGASSAAGSVAGLADRAPVLLRPLDGEVLERSGFEVAWRPTADALAYTVQLMNARGDVVWEGRANGDHLLVPPDAGLRPGQRFFAWVIAETRGGAALRSPVVSLRVAPD